MIKETVCCVPRAKNHNALFLEIGLAVAGIALFITAPLFMSQYVFGGQLAAMLMLVMAIVFLFKYQLNKNEYLLAPGQNGGTVFLIRQKQGKQEKTVCQLPLARILTIDEVSPGHPAPAVDSKDDFTYIATLGAKEYQILRTRGARGLLTVKIEADEAFMAVLREEFSYVTAAREEQARLAREKAAEEDEEED